jgi:cbb3-type cytochrome c oxidase subunit II
MNLKMTPKTVVFGALFILTAVILTSVYWPWATRVQTPSDIFRQRTSAEEKGRQLYIANGCSYCHTQSIRKLDWGLGAERISQAGDYVTDRPILLGSERTGPDLSQAGGEHPDDWHVAHFINPRSTRPNSIMPLFEYLGEENIQNLTRYVQSLGLKQADQRMQRQKFWKKKAIEAYEAGVEENVNWLHSQVPEGWRKVPNPYGFLHRLSRSHWRWDGAGPAVYVSTAFEFYDPERQRRIRWDPLLSNHERHYRNDDAVF